MIANVAIEDVAVATGILFLYRGTGHALGASLSGALLQAVLTNQLQKRITGPDAFEVWPSLPSQSLGATQLTAKRRSSIGLNIPQR
jgi:hypothetical protein